MTRFTKLALVALLAAPVVGFYAGCDRGGDAQSSSSAGNASDPLPAGLVLNEAPANARNVADVVKDAKDSDEVVVTGKVGGRKDPFVAGRAVMTVVDVNQQSCKEIEGDSCPTPWDYCCVPQSLLQPNLATVQFVGADGKPLKADFTSVNGLKPFSEVVVKGQVRREADGKSVVINATGLYVKKS
jgi:hypothetical protein